MNLQNNLKHKDYYIKKISKESDAYGDKLIDLLNKYNKSNLQQITLSEAAEYYTSLTEKRRAR